MWRHATYRRNDNHSRIVMCVWKSNEGNIWHVLVWGHLVGVMPSLRCDVCNDYHLQMAALDCAQPYEIRTKRLDFIDTLNFCDDGPFFKYRCKNPGRHVARATRFCTGA